MYDPNRSPSRTWMSCAVALTAWIVDNATGLAGSETS